MKRSTTNTQRAFPGTIAVTGAAGDFGALVIRRLHRTDNIISIDHRPFPAVPSDVPHVESDLRRKECRDAFRRKGIKAVVRIGPFFLQGDGHVKEDQFARAIESFAKLLEYCVTYKVEKLVLLSSADAYGALPRNHQFLTEDAPLLAADLPILRDIDMLAQNFFWKQPNIETVILRPSHITGAVTSAMSRYLRLSPVPSMLGFDPMIQLVHEEDVVSAIRLALRPGQRGVFNIAGPQPIPLSRILRRLGRTAVPILHLLVKPLVNRLPKLAGLDIDPAYVDFLRFVCMVDDTRAREMLGYAPQRDLAQTLAAVDLWS